MSWGFSTESLWVGPWALHLSSGVLVLSSRKWEVVTQMGGGGGRVPPMAVVKHPAGVWSQGSEPGSLFTVTLSVCRVEPLRDWLSTQLSLQGCQRWVESGHQAGRVPGA